MQVNRIPIYYHLRLSFSPENLITLSDLPDFITTGPVCGASSRKVPRRTFKAFAILISGDNDGMSAPLSSRFTNSILSLTFLASSSIEIFLFSLNWRIFSPT